MKKMKKLIPLCLALLLALSILAVPAGAASSGADCFVRQDANGSYSVADPDEAREEESDQSASGEEETLLPAYFVGSEEILRLDNGQYLTKRNDGSYVLAVRLELDTQDFDKNTPLFEEYQVPRETIQSAKAAIQAQQGNPDFTYAIYVTNGTFTPTVETTTTIPQGEHIISGPVVVCVVVVALVALCVWQQRRSKQ
jgi:hypothetical protein